MTEPLDIPGEEPPAIEGPTLLAPVAAVETHGLTRRFGRDLVAVDDVRFSVPAGEVFGLVGPDGAGKSTLIRMLATVLEPSTGDADVFGHSVRTDAHSVKTRIGYMSQRFSLYGDLTVAENLAFFARLRGGHGPGVKSRSSDLLEFAGLTEFADRQAQYLSGGMKQKLALAATLIHEPDLLFLDEPTTGVDPVSRREFWRIIAGLHQRGITVFVATQYMDEAERCSTVAFMDGGRILFSDSPANLKRRVPGSVYEIHADDQRGAVRALADRPWALASTVYGDLARVIVANNGPTPDEVSALLSSAGIAAERVEPARMDMEATFAFLAEESR